jgi:hypothetical protein
LGVYDLVDDWRKEGCAGKGSIQLVDGVCRHNLADEEEDHAEYEARVTKVYIGYGTDVD